MLRTLLCVYVFVENALRSLLEALTSPPYAPMQHLEREQALAKQFAEILHFTLSFDELKVRRRRRREECGKRRGRGREGVISVKLKTKILINLVRHQLCFHNIREG